MGRDRRLRRESLKYTLLITITELSQSAWSYLAGGLLRQVRVMCTTIHTHTHHRECLCCSAGISLVVSGGCSVPLTPPCGRQEGSTQLCVSGTLLHAHVLVHCVGGGRAGRRTDITDKLEVSLIHSYTPIHKATS